MMRYAQTYRRPVCFKCFSRMVTHVEVAAGEWRYGCSMCKTELPAGVVEQVEAEEWYTPAVVRLSIRERKKRGG
jgi:hypothetical protein